MTNKITCSPFDAHRYSQLNEHEFRAAVQRIQTELGVPRFLDNPDFRATSRRPEEFTESAVLLPIIKRAELSVLFTLRADHLSTHAGEISFPGGKADANDTSPTVTALRETEEELGLSAEQIEVLIELPRLQVLSGFAITPIVGLVNESFAMTLNENEVKEVFEVPLSHCVNTANFQLNETYFRGEPRAFFSLQWQQRTVWGATAAILHGFSQLMNEILTPK